MKKQTAFLFVVLGACLLFALAGCHKNNSPTAPPDVLVNSWKGKAEDNNMHSPIPRVTMTAEAESTYETEHVISAGDGWTPATTIKSARELREVFIRALPEFGSPYSRYDGNRPAVPTSVDGKLVYSSWVPLSPSLHPFGSTAAELDGAREFFHNDNAKFSKWLRGRQ